MVKEDRKIEDVIELHKAFWRMENSKPLLNVEPYTPLTKDTKIPLSDGRLVSDDVDLDPDLIDPKLFLKKTEQYAKSSIFHGDFIKVWAPYDLCWTQAFTGCPIHVSSGKIWAKPFLNDVAKVNFSSLEANGKWVKKLLEFTDILVKSSQARYPVIQPLFRGPIDMAASALGPDNLCIAAYKHPEELRRFLDFCAQTFLDALNAQLELIPEFHGGYGCLFGIWAPNLICYDQADHSVLLSQQLYEKIFLPYDQKIINSFKYSAFHLHSAAIHIAKSLLKIHNLKAIEIAIDYPYKTFSSQAEQLIPVFKEIQKSKPLIVNGAVTEKELHLILEELSPKGLAIDLQKLD